MYTLLVLFLRTAEGFIKKHVLSKPKWYSLFIPKECSLQCPMVVGNLEIYGTGHTVSSIETWGLGVRKN